MSASAVWKLKESGTLHQDFEGEVVLIDLDTGNYFNLPGAAGVLWGRVAAGAVSAALLADELVAQYDVEHAVALADATAFLADLEREGLIEEGAGAAIAPGSTPAKARATYVAPRLEVFRELQDLLLLDPIHEVNPAVGWPQSAGVLQGEAGAIIRLSGDDVLAASVDTTTVVVNRDRGLYCRLDGDAARAWHAMGAGPIFPEVRPSCGRCWRADSPSVPAKTRSRRLPSRPRETSRYTTSCTNRFDRGAIDAACRGLQRRRPPRPSATVWTSGMRQAVPRPPRLSIRWPATRSP